MRAAFVAPVPLRAPRRAALTLSRRAPTLTARRAPRTQPPRTPPAPPATPLPPSSRACLASAGLLWLSSVSLPTVLALRDAAATASPLLPHLSAYASHYAVVLYATLFGVLHSGLASLRPLAAPVTGERLYRVVFALTSLPSAALLVAFFVAHRYDGAPLWSLQGVPHMRAYVAATTALSFAFLYPATFNLLEVAAVARPTFRIYETGVTRITRHPQLTGQVLWCVSHAAWLGSSFAVTASLVLVAHHCFGAWNGDRRLRDRYGDEWRQFADRTSVLPFVALARGQQKIVAAEFFRGAYVGVALAVWAFYTAHPLVLRLIGEMAL